MSIKHSIVSCLGCATLGFLLVNGQALGGSSMASTDSAGPKFGTPTGSGTLTLEATSVQFKPPAGPNAMTSDSGVSGGGPAAPVKGVIAVDGHEVVPGPPPTPPHFFPDLVGVSNGAKPATGGRVVTSTSDTASSSASYIPPGNTAFPNGLLLANATVGNKPIVGQAAAFAEDPYTVNPGVYRLQISHRFDRPDQCPDR